ncbi:sugar O-acetyltransferase [Bifidobacterium saguinibicoloris]|uniref:sugar O-acetyltransferase n=1 Tax=Bifidobacterium saguinibicoloris TaxID=2834433 RepID=UPI001C55AF5C|nr:sugar O-acetyltransferase [Bifidobacterium saguinibicoloris]MBW3080733.1 sugar O-acetyltransferase [Bifidobacterium saguinibicoloris]
MTVPQRVLDIMHSPDLYLCGDPEMDEAQHEQMRLLHRLNASEPCSEERDRLLHEFFGEVGEGAWIELPVHANWGCNTHWGAHSYANFNLTLVDDGEIFIGEHVMIGPNVTIATTGHPIRPDLRERAAQFSAPVHIGRNAWLGANVTVMPGVTIGENTVVGACSLVTHDLPANVVAFGTPCRVVREIGEKDRDFYRPGMRIPEGV